MKKFLKIILFTILGAVALVAIAGFIKFNIIGDDIITVEEYQQVLDSNPASETTTQTQAGEDVPNTVVVSEDPEWVNVKPGCHEAGVISVCVRKEYAEDTTNQPTPILVELVAYDLELDQETVLYEIENSGMALNQNNNLLIISLEKNLQDDDGYVLRYVEGQAGYGYGETQVIFLTKETNQQLGFEMVN